MKIQSSFELRLSTPREDRYYACPRCSTRYTVKNFNITEINTISSFHCGCGYNTNLVARMMLSISPSKIEPMKHNKEFDYNNLF